MIIQRYFITQRHCDKNQLGYASLIAVLAAGAIGLSAALWLVLSGVSASKTSLSLIQSSQARFLADTCAEEALLQIQQSTPFAGSANFSLGSGFCSYTVTNLGGANRQVIALGEVSTIVRKVKIMVEKINPQINIFSWEEVADF